MVEQELKDSASAFLSQVHDLREVNVALLDAIEELLNLLQTPGEKAAIQAGPPKDAPVPSGQIPEKGNQPREFGELPSDVKFKVSKIPTK